MTSPHTSPDAARMQITSTKSAPDWQVSQGLVPYPDALQTMEERVAGIHDGSASELIWLLEHPPLITSGTSAKAEDLIDPDRFPVHHAGRGGQYTYHGPGQRIAYVMLDLRKRGQDLRRYIFRLEEWIIETLKVFDIKGERREGRVGIWVVRENGREDKIAAILPRHLHQSFTGSGTFLVNHPLRHQRTRRDVRRRPRSQSDDGGVGWRDEGEVWGGFLDWL